MSQRSSIDDDRRARVASLMNSVNYFAFVVALQIFERESCNFGKFARPSHIISQFVQTVDFGFSLPEKVQIRSVDQEHCGHIDNATTLVTRT